MAAAEAGSRNGRKPGKDVDRLANAARLRALEINLGVPVKRHRDPGTVTNTNPFVQGKDAKGDSLKDETTIVMRGF